MKVILFPAIFFTSFIFCQIDHWSREKYELDTILDFKEGTEVYTFYLDTVSQGFYMDTFRCTELPRILIRVVNNTGKPVVQYYKTRDSRITWFGNKRYGDIIQPGEYIEFKSGWPSRNYGFTIPYNSPIYMPYAFSDSTGQQLNFVLRVWGKVHLERPPEKKEVIVTDTTPVIRTKKIPPPVKQDSVLPEKRITSDGSSLEYMKKGIFYRGEHVNQRTKKGLKKGKWIYLNELNQLMRVEFFSGETNTCDSVFYVDLNTRQYFKKEYSALRADSVIRIELNKAGIPYRFTYLNGTVKHPPNRSVYAIDGKLQYEFYPDPNKREIEFYPGGNPKEIKWINENGSRDSLKQYHSNGVVSRSLYYEQGNLIRDYTFNTSGYLLTEQYGSRRDQTSYSYEEGSDSILTRIRYYNNKPVYKETGVFRNNLLWDGIRYGQGKSASNREIVFREGKENGIMYKGQWINRRDSLGLQGLQLTFTQSDSINSVAVYHNGLTDSIRTFFENGNIRSVCYTYGNFNACRKEYIFYLEGPLQIEKGGFVKDTVMMRYYLSGRKQEVKIGYQTIFYSDNDDTCSYRVIYPYQAKNRMNPEELNIYPYINGYSSMEDRYKNCRLYMRTYPQYAYYEGIEGDESRPISYHIESGTFKDNELYSGYRAYFNHEHQLYKKKQVIKGKEMN